MADDELIDRIRAVHRAFPSGVAIVTTSLDDEPLGLAVNAFSSVSLEPPLVLVCVKTTAQTHDHLYANDHLGVNFLAHDQGGIAMRFAQSGGDKFADLAWTPGIAGTPLITGAAGHFETTVEQRLRAGTHTIFIARVVDAVAGDRPPLLYHAGGFWDGAKLVAASTEEHAA